MGEEVLKEVDRFDWLAGYLAASTLAIPPMRTHIARILRVLKARIISDMHVLQEIFCYCSSPEIQDLADESASRCPISTCRSTRVGAVDFSSTPDSVTEQLEELLRRNTLRIYDCEPVLQEGRST